MQRWIWCECGQTWSLKLKQLLQNLGIKCPETAENTNAANCMTFKMKTRKRGVGGGALN